MPEVPCCGCTECCRGPDRTLILTPEDIWSGKYRTNGPALANKWNGDCVYLTDQGCGIYKDRPQACREFDCRTLVAVTAAPWRIREAGARALGRS